MRRAPPTPRRFSRTPKLINLQSSQQPWPATGDFEGADGKIGSLLLFAWFKPSGFPRRFIRNGAAVASAAAGSGRLL